MALYVSHGLKKPHILQKYINIIQVFNEDLMLAYFQYGKQNHFIIFICFHVRKPISSLATLLSSL